MSRTAEEVRAELLSLLPRGWAWPRDAASNHGRLMLAAAHELARFEAAAEAMLPEADPGAATKLLDDYERVLGADPCGRLTPGLSLEARQMLARQRWTARGGASIPYLLAQAAALGAVIRIEEGAPSVCGASVCGDELSPPENRFEWRVHLPVDPPTALACVLARLAPSHTTIVFVEAP